MSKARNQQSLMSRGEFFRFVFPLMASAVFQQSYALINAGILGRIRSAEAVAAIGSCAFLLTLQHFLFNGMTTGFGIFQCRYLENRGEDVPAGMVFWGSLYLTAALGIIGCLTAMFVRPILSFLRVPEDLLPEAFPYAAWILAGSGLSALKNYLIWTMQGLKKTGAAGAVSALSVVTQTVLTVFLTGILRLPVWAAAAAISLNHLLVSVLLGILLMNAAGPELSFCRPSVIPDGIYRELLRSGLSKSTMMAMAAAAGIFRQRTVNRFPVQEIAGYTFACTVSNIFQVIVGAYGTAAAVLTGRWYGLGDFTCLQKDFRRILGHGIFIALTLSAAAVLFSEPLVLAAAGRENTEAALYGSSYLAVSSLGLAMLVIYLTGRYALQSTGNNVSQILLGMVEMISGIWMLETVVRRGGFPVMGWYPVVTWGLCAAVSFILMRPLLAGRSCE